MTVCDFSRFLGDFASDLGITMDKASDILVYRLTADKSKDIANSVCDYMELLTRFSTRNQKEEILTTTIAYLLELIAKDISAVNDALEKVKEVCIDRMSEL